jgi:hypothetical protein
MPNLPAVPSVLAGLIGPGRRCDAFGKLASYAAGVGDVLSGDLTKRIRQAGDFDAVSYNSKAYTYGQVTGIGLSLALGFANPCTAAGAAGTGLRALAGLQGVGSLANAADNLAAGNYLAAAADGVGAFLGFLGFRTSCFAAETPMRTAWGAVRADEVRVGTPLLSRDEYDFEAAVVPKVVEEVFIREALIWHLRVLGQTIRSTAEHPFFVRDKGWTPLNQIHTGDSIWTEVSGWVTVDVVEDTGTWETVYNFRIADHHTYFVGSEEWGFSVWAHNACVYQSAEAGGVVRYVGIADRGLTKTRNARLAAATERSRQAGYTTTESVIPGLENITEKEAQAVEYVLVKYYGRISVPKETGTLLNKDLGTGFKGHEAEYEAIGTALLKRVNYPGF